MYNVFSKLRRTSTSLAATMAALAALATVGAGSHPAAAGSRAPGEVDATYKISLNGFDLGTFRFTSGVGANSAYYVDTDVEISAILGIFKWKGVTHASGTFAEAAAVQPEGFKFEFESSARSGVVSMGFGKEGVETFSAEPPLPPMPEEVPLTRAHLKNVVDPLSAIMAMTHVDAKDPCGRKVSIFDGRQRFDLDLRYSRTMPLPGTTDKAVVCRVKYQPIAGYVPDEQTLAMAKSDGIEIAFRVLPSVKLMLPQSVTIPTVAGNAELSLVAVNIKTGDQGKFAAAN